MNMVELFHRIPFIDEAMWEVIRSFFKIGTEKAVDKVRDDSVQTARRAVSLLWTSKVSANARRNWRRVWDDPAFKPHRQSIEVALEDLLERYEERQGFFPKVAEPERVSGNPKDKNKPVTTIKPKFEANTEFGKPEVLFIQAIETAGESPDEVKRFVEAITNQTIVERTQEQIAEMLKKVKRNRWKIFWFFVIYFGIIFILGLLMVVSYGIFIWKPEWWPFLILGLIFTGLLAFAADPILKLLLSKG